MNPVSTLAILAEPFGPFGEDIFRRHCTPPLRQWHLRRNSDIIGFDNGKDVNGQEYLALVVFPDTESFGRDVTTVLTEDAWAFVEAEFSRRAVDRQTRVNRLHDALKLKDVRLKIAIQGKMMGNLHCWTNAPECLIMSSWKGRQFRVATMHPLMFQRSKIHLLRWVLISNLMRLAGGSPNSTVHTPEWFAKRWCDVSATMRRLDASEDGRTFHRADALNLLTEHCESILSEQYFSQKSGKSAPLIDSESWSQFAAEADALRTGTLVRQVRPKRPRRRHAPPYSHKSKSTKLPQPEVVPFRTSTTKYRPNVTYDPDFYEESPACSDQEPTPFFQKAESPDGHPAATIPLLLMLPSSGIQGLILRCGFPGCNFVADFWGWAEQPTLSYNDHASRALEEHRKVHYGEWGVRKSRTEESETLLWEYHRGDLAASSRSTVKIEDPH